VCILGVLLHVALDEMSSFQYHVEDDYDNAMDNGDHDRSMNDLCDTFAQQNMHGHISMDMDLNNMTSNTMNYTNANDYAGSSSNSVLSSLVDQIERVRLDGVASALSESAVYVSAPSSSSVFGSQQCICQLEIVLDCANIGWNFGIDAFDMMGVLLSFAYFQQFGNFVKVTAFLPASFVRKKPADGSRGNSLMQTSDWETINALVHSRAISVVPAGENDDRYILQYAWNNNGFIVSNDFFMDHVTAVDDPSERHQMIQWLLDVRCSYTFTRDQLILSPESKLYGKLLALSRNAGAPGDL
jgi:hypothetical protein